MNEKSKKGVVRTVKITGAFVTLVVLGFLAYALANVSTINDQISEQIYLYGGSALFVISFLLDLLPQLISPIVALGTGILMGVAPHIAIINVIAGSTAGSIVGFFLGRRYMFNIVSVLIKKRDVERMTRLTNKHGKIVVLISAISPLPYLPVLIGTTNLSWKNFVVYGLMPRALGLAFYGYIVSLF